MPSYLVETYLASGDTLALRTCERRVRLERSIHIPADELCFLVFDAPSSREAARAARRAGLDPIRVVEAIVFGQGEQ